MKMLSLRPWPKLSNVCWRFVYSSGKPCTVSPLSVLSFPCLMAVLSSGAIQNNTHTDTPCWSNGFLKFQTTIASARAWERLWMSGHNWPVSTPSPLTLHHHVHLSPLTSWLSNQLTPPRLSNTSTCNTTPAPTRSHGVTHTIPAAGLFLSVEWAHTHTHNTHDQRNTGCSKRSGLQSISENKMFSSQMLQMRVFWRSDLNRMEISFMHAPGMPKSYCKSKYVAGYIWIYSQLVAVYVAI